MSNDGETLSGTAKGFVQSRAQGAGSLTQFRALEPLAASQNRPRPQPAPRPLPRVNLGRALDHSGLSYRKALEAP